MVLQFDASMYKILIYHNYGIAVFQWIMSYNKKCYDHF